MADVKFTGERIVPQADNCEPTFAEKMYQEHSARYLFASQLVKGRSVLDVGCGVGYGAWILAERGATRVVAFDLAEDAIQHARHHYAHPAVSFEVESAEAFDFNDQFDVVTCFELIEHVNDYVAVFERIVRALKPDGIVVMSTPRALEVKRTHFHTKEFSLIEFKQLFSKYFGTFHFYFENNHFSSLITAERPASIDVVETLKDQYSVDLADYFIVAASPSAEVIVDGLKPVIALNDDRYVLNLERDVGILHRVEDNLKQQLSDREAELRASQNDCRAVMEQRDVARQEIGVLQQEIAAMELALREKDEQLVIAKNSEAKLAALLAEEAARQSQVDNDIVRMSAELEEERVKRSKAEADLAVARADNEAIELECVARSADAESLRVRLDRAAAEAAYLARLIEMMRESRSWRLTRPLRGSASLVRALKLHSQRAFRYWEANGTLALIRAVGRKARSRLLGNPGSMVTPPMLSASSLRADVAAPAPTELSVLPELRITDAALGGVEMFIGCWEGGSKRYRVYNVAAALGMLGCRVNVRLFAELPLLVSEARRPRIVVVFRAPYDSSFGVEAFFAYTRRNGIKVVFDVDDLVFDPDIVHRIDAFHRLSEGEKALYMDGVRKYRRMLLESDLVSVTTKYLADEVQKLGKPVAIIRNSINAEQLKVAGRILAERAAGTKADPITVGYFSGSKTHQKDFAQAEAALLRVMCEIPELRLLIVGFLDLGEPWREFESRIDRRDFLPYLEMLEVLGRCNINIAPLDVDNPFCESKSELKYFEAAIVEVPTVASATEPFRAAIESGTTGFIASDEGEWYAALKALASDPALRARMGRAARASAIERFGPRTIGQQALEAYGIPHPDRRVQVVSERLRIDWVVPPIIIGGGGHRNIFRAAHHLKEFGHDVHLHIANMAESDEQLATMIRSHFYPFRGHVHRYDGSFERTDVVFATHWSTVDAALRAKALAREIMYFVQDFEPAFAPMGSEYVLAENTYRLGLYHITSGPWCERILREQFHAAADHFRFPIDKEIYFPRPRSVTHKRLMFFAKPEMPRRCFELGILALQHMHRMRPDVEIVMFGSRQITGRKIDFPVTFLKVVPTLDDLAELYSNADTGMVFSTTNPSLVPYEMMACGLPVIDLDRPGNEVNYDDRRDIALLANPLPDVMARQVVELLDSEEDRQARSRNGLAFAAGFPTEEEMARRIEALIINRLQTRAASVSLHSNLASSK